MAAPYYFTQPGRICAGKVNLYGCGQGSCSRESASAKSLPELHHGHAVLLPTGLAPWGPLTISLARVE